MDSFVKLILPIVVIAMTQVSCIRKPSNSAVDLFKEGAPQSHNFKSELQYLEFTGRINKSQLQHIEDQLTKVEQKLGVPKALLWCVLFQESRFDPFKNALSKLPAKGLGQFTPSALEEVNTDTDLFDPRTSDILNAQLHPKSLPINFKLRMPASSQEKVKESGRKELFPEQPKTSYFRTTTAIFASASYLNNRYQQLKKALDRQGIKYNSQVLWLYAAAAYNKGSRSIFLVLTNEYLTRGESALKELLNSPKASYDLLTHPEKLDYPLREIWKQKTRTRYVSELLRNMEVISSCAISENHL
jgi:hypothetical protein